jgi:hypothetical protein
VVVVPMGPRYKPDIQQDLDALGCSKNECHGAGSAPMKVTPMAAAMAELMANYNEVKQRAMMGEMSPLLRKNLAGSPLVHVGGTVFPSNDHPVYKRWLEWINAGAPSGIE